MQKLTLLAFLTLSIGCNQKQEKRVESSPPASADVAKLPSANADVAKLPPVFSFYGTWAKCVTSPFRAAADNSVKSIKQIDTFSEDGKDIRQELYFKDTECKVPFTAEDDGKTFKPGERGITGSAQSPNYEKCGQPIDYTRPGSLSVPEHWCIDKLISGTTSDYYFEITKDDGAKGCLLSAPSNATQINPFVFEMRGDKLKIHSGPGYYIAKDVKAKPDAGLRAKALESCEEILAEDNFEPPYYTRVSP